MKPIRLSSVNDHRKAHDALVRTTVDMLRWHFRADQAHFWPNTTQAAYSPKKGAWIAGRTYKGAADILGVVKGQHVELEAKTGEGRLEPAQKAHRDAVTLAGGAYGVFNTPEQAVQIVRAIMAKEE